MWIFLNNAALSIVEDRNEHDRLLVRARVAGDIEAVFPDVKAQHTPNADYHYRVFLDRRKVAGKVLETVMNIDYDNFKNSIDPVDHARHDAYLDAWCVMRDYQFKKAV